MSDDEERVTKPFKFVTDTGIFSEAVESMLKYNLAGFDARFPHQNQTKHCWQNFVDYQKCINAKGEDFPPCRQFYLAYRSLCPSAWVERWNDQIEAGNFPTNLNP